MLKIIFDVDGIMTDITSPSLNLLQSTAKKTLNGEPMSPSESRIFNSEKWAVLDETQLQNIINTDLSVLTNWDFSPLPDYIAALFRTAFRLTPELYEDPIPQYNTRTERLLFNNASSFTPNNWVANCKSKTSFDAWKVLLTFLTEFAIVEIHTHMLSEQAAIGRTNWLNKTFGQEHDRLHFRVDCGNAKSVSDGDILIEDCLENILKSTAHTKILHCMNHNRLSEEKNYNSWKTYGSPSFLTYGNFYELCITLINEICTNDYEREQLRQDLHVRLKGLI